MDPFTGEIRPVGFNFAPLGWALCSGQLLPIEQNEALFSLLGTTYGGDGQVTFALPDLRGRAVEGAQLISGPGQPLGAMYGQETTTLTLNNLPSHSHGVAVSNAAATTGTPAGNVPAKAARTVYGVSGAETLAADTVQIAGGSQPHNNMQPYLCLNYIICLDGLFPQR